MWLIRLNGRLAGVFMLAMLASCAGIPASSTGPDFYENPRGVYRGRDGDLVLQVTLRDDGTCRVLWLSKKVEKGDCSGRWSILGESLVLEVQSREGNRGMPEYSHIASLKEFRLVRGEHRFMLVPEWNFDELKQTGVSPAIACYWEEEAPAPTGAKSKQSNRSSPRK